MGIQFVSDSRFSFQWRSKHNKCGKLAKYSTNDAIIYFLKFSLLQTLYTLKTMKCLKTFPRLNNFNWLLALCWIRILGFEEMSVSKFTRYLWKRTLNFRLCAVKKNSALVRAIIVFIENFDPNLTCIL